LIAGSTSPPNITIGQMEAIYDKIRKGNFNSLDEYFEIRDKVYVLKSCGEYYSCSCYVGQKEAIQCKHAALCAVKQGWISFTAEHRDPIVPSRRVRGRPAQALRGGALSQR
jgi:hypothetical protein